MSKQEPGPDRPEARARRLAEALRENLRRRKAQARQRKSRYQDDPRPAAACGEPDPGDAGD